MNLLSPGLTKRRVKKDLDRISPEGRTLLPRGSYNRSKSLDTVAEDRRAPGVPCARTNKEQMG